MQVGCRHKLAIDSTARTCGIIRKARSPVAPSQLVCCDAGSRVLAAGLSHRSKPFETGLRICGSWHLTQHFHRFACLLGFGSASIHTAGPRVASYTYLMPRAWALTMWLMFAGKRAVIRVVATSMHKSLSIWRTDILLYRLLVSTNGY